MVDSTIYILPDRPIKGSGPMGLYGSIRFVPQSINSFNRFSEISKFLTALSQSIFSNVEFDAETSTE